MTDVLSNSDYRDLFAGADVTAPNGSVVTTKAVQGSTADSYGEYIEGECWVVFEMDGKFYKKWGYQDSYGSTYWDGGLMEVTPKTVTVEVWE